MILTQNLEFHNIKNFPCEFPNCLLIRQMFETDPRPENWTLDTVKMAFGEETAKIVKNLQSKKITLDDFIVIEKYLISNEMLILAYIIRPPNKKNRSSIWVHIAIEI